MEILHLLSFLFYILSTKSYSAADTPWCFHQQYIFTTSLKASGASKTVGFHPYFFFKKKYLKQENAFLSK